VNRQPDVASVADSATAGNALFALLLCLSLLGCDWRSVREGTFALN